ncbi:hypothetical protein ES703_114506 [subsurface metagenome]
MVVREDELDVLRPVDDAAAGGIEELLRVGDARGQALHFLQAGDVLAALVRYAHLQLPLEEEDAEPPLRGGLSSHGARGAGADYYDIVQRYSS